jgi:excisionase family DNA binding protein
MLTYLSPSSVAKALDIHRTTAMRLMKNGVLPAFELYPSQWRCSEQALERYLRKRELEGRQARRQAHTAEEDSTGDIKAESPALRAGSKRKLSQSQQQVR